MKAKIPLALGGLVALLLLVVTLGGVGTVGADHANSTELANQTVAVTNDTTAVWVEVTNTSYNGTTHNASVTIFGVDENGTETQVDSVNMSAGPNSTDYYETSAEPSVYDSYRVIVDGETVELVETGSIEKVAGGGGSSDGVDIFNDTIFGVPIFIWAIVLVGGYFMLTEG